LLFNSHQYADDIAASLAPAASQLLSHCQQGISLSSPCQAPPIAALRRRHSRHYASAIFSEPLPASFHYAAAISIDYAIELALITPMRHCFYYAISLFS